MRTRPLRRSRRGKSPPSPRAPLESYVGLLCPTTLASWEEPALTEGAAVMCARPLRRPAVATRFDSGRLHRDVPWEEPAPTEGAAGSSRWNFLALRRGRVVGGARPR